MRFFYKRILVSTLMLPALAFGQKPEPATTASEFGIFQNQNEYYDFMGNLKSQGASNPELMALVPLVNDIVLQQPIGSTGSKYNATGTTLGLLADAEVRGELEMLDEQYKDLQATQQAIQKRAAEQLRQLDFSDLGGVDKRIREIRDQSERELQQTLLPHQMDRLRQILAQSQLRRRSLIEVLTSEPIKSRLEIGDKQSTDLKSAERRISDDLERQIQELRDQARQKLLSQLKRSQRQQVEDLFGEPFAFQQARRQPKSENKQSRGK